MKPQLFFGELPEKGLLMPIKNAGYGFKPLGGLWTSTYENGKSEWVEWCEDVQFFTTNSRDGWLLTPNNEARIFEIDNLEQLKFLLNKYSKDSDERYAILDFEAISKDYDAIHLTSNGQLETRYTIPGLYGWDVNLHAGLDGCLMK